MKRKEGDLGVWAAEQRQSGNKQFTLSSFRQKHRLHCLSAASAGRCGLQHQEGVTQHRGHAASLNQALRACQRLYQALKSHWCREYTVSHTPAATNKWWTRFSAMVTLIIWTEGCQSECRDTHQPKREGWRSRSSYFYPAEAVIIKLQWLLFQTLEQLS